MTVSLKSSTTMHLQSQPHTTSLSLWTLTLVFTLILQIPSISACPSPGVPRHPTTPKPITIRIAPHDANPWSGYRHKNADEVFQYAAPKTAGMSRRILATSIHESLFAAPDSSDNNTNNTNDNNTLPHHPIVSGSANSFVHSIWHAYSSHHHLTLRPDDMWLTILTQLAFHITANAETLRSHFVTHTGTKDLTVHAFGTISTIDIGMLAYRLGEAMEPHLASPDLRAWILPSFSTTTTDDRVTASVVLMGAMQKYFSYTITLTCGIPSVTLLGQRADWMDILARIDRIEEIDAECALWAGLLRPVVRGFVAAFDVDAEDEAQIKAVREFWDRSVHQTSRGSEADYLSGWVTAFCFWDEEGMLLYREPPVVVTVDEQRRREMMGDASPPPCEIDGVRYHHVDTDQIPSGYSTVPVTVDDNGKEYQTVMVAGLVGILGEADGTRIRPLSGWCMYEKEDEAVLKAKRERYMVARKWVGENGGRWGSEEEREERDRMWADYEDLRMFGE